MGVDIFFTSEHYYFFESISLQNMNLLNKKMGTFFSVLMRGFLLYCAKISNRNK